MQFRRYRRIRQSSTLKFKLTIRQVAGPPPLAKAVDGGPKAKSVGWPFYITIRPHTVKTETGEIRETHSCNSLFRV